jgi:N-acyl-D-amino-acid deacylase
VIFDPETIQDRATFTSPMKYAEGIEYMVVNGTMVIDEGRLTGATPGRILRHGR